MSCYEGFLAVFWVFFLNLESCKVFLLCWELMVKEIG
jgi:hypothetical protein